LSIRYKQGTKMFKNVDGYSGRVLRSRPSLSSNKVIAGQ
jgi:hypothetical protein